MTNLNPSTLLVMIIARFEKQLFHSDILNSSSLLTYLKFKFLLQESI